jgi:hypothetical protein
VVAEETPPRHRRRERRRGTPAAAPQDAAQYAGPAPAPPAGTTPPADRAATGDGPRAAGDRPGGQASGGSRAEERATSADRGWAGGDSGAGGAGTGGAFGEEERPGRAVRKPRRTDPERGLRGIVGAGPSQVGLSAAMRARDAARPTAEDLAAAERDLTVIRRHYVPPDTLPGSR